MLCGKDIINREKSVDHFRQTGVTPQLSTIYLLLRSRNYIFGGSVMNSTILPIYSNSRLALRPGAQIGNTCASRFYAARRSEASASEPFCLFHARLPQAHQRS